MTSIIRRLAENQIREALTDSPVVLIKGPRQSGKTTLAQLFTEDTRPYLTLDDETVLHAAQSDPVGFVRGLDRTIIDEIQRAPALLRSLKKAVDEDRRSGRFLLTGSADLMTLPIVSDSLAGRMESITLYPFGTAELQGTSPGFLKKLFGDGFQSCSDPLMGDALVNHVLIGGYPEMVRRTSPQRRSIWVRDYLDALVQRDVRDISEIEKFDALRQLLRLLSHHAGQLLNFNRMGRDTGLNSKTAARYLALLEQLFLVRRIEAWHRNDLKRLLKTPKLAFVDSGILAAQRGLNSENVLRDRTAFGPVLESFVVSEIIKLIGWSGQDIRLSHFRDKDGSEVDLVLEDGAGRICGIEVKASATIKNSDFSGLRKFAAATETQFHRGCVLYDGDAAVPFGDHLQAVPISALWDA